MFKFIKFCIVLMLSLVCPLLADNIDGDDYVHINDFALLATSWQGGIGSLVINELMASNSSTIQDPQGEYDDWIEIYNAGQNAINIGSMYLSDDLSEPTKWQIPSNSPSATTIPARGYVLIWADNESADAGFHAGFKLDADGGEVVLFDRDGVTLVDSVTYDKQHANISFGRYPNASNTLQFMASPTPGSINGSGYLGLVSELTFSYNRGFYNAPFSVTITTETEGAVIYYTLDGSEPYNFEMGQPTGIFYSSPILISTTTCLRAVAFKTGWKPTNIDTHTYIFLDDVCRQATG